MQKVECSLQSNRLFGETFPKWRRLEDEDRHFLNLPNHVSDQVFRVLVAKTPAAHLFEIVVSEQCPKDAYSHLGRGISKLKLETAIVNVIHNRSSNAHVMLWTDLQARRHHHMDVDFSHLSRLDRKILDCLQEITPHKRDQLFALVQGKSQASDFFRSLHRHLKKIDCSNEDSWHALVDLALKVIFLIFVQRKGWLNFDPYYLESKMAFCINSGLSVVNAFFKPLFARLEGVSIKEHISLGALPRLGGGLFTFKPESLPPIPNTWCLELYQTLISQYSFSLFEAREGRRVVGIGPEMLGHVFENLLINRDRKAQGAYYTPTDVAEKQVKAAFEAWTQHNSSKGDDFLRKRLEKIRVLDPSCGSGAYLVAAFQALLKLRLAQTPSHERYNGKLFALKRSIMLENLYGVDINPVAIRLTEVRLWLNMIQDLEISEPGKAPALPNLQHHLRPGDFLGQHLPDHPERMIKWHKFQMLEQLRGRFPSSSAGKRPEVLKNIYRLEDELQKYLEKKEFEDHKAVVQCQMAQGALPGHHLPARREKLNWPRPENSPLHVVFSRVFLEKGFDLILGNPPWLSAAKINRQQKRSILQHMRLPSGLALQGQVDLSLYFLCASFNYLKDGGHLGFMMPGKILQARFSSGLRAWLKERCKVDYLFDYGVDQNLLFKADTFPLAIGITRSKPAENHEILVEQKGRDFSRSFKLRQADLSGHGSPWKLGYPEEDPRLEEMGRWPKLEDLPYKIQRGVVTSAKKHFVFEKRPSYIPQNRVRLLLRGRDIKRDFVKPGQFIYWPFDQGPLWFQGAAQGEKQWLGKTGKLIEQGHGGARLPYRSKPTDGWVVAWKYLASSWEATLYRGSWVPDQITYFMNLDHFETAWRLFAWLNMPEATGWIRQIAERGKDRHFFFYAHTVRQLPFPPDLFTRNMIVPKEKDLFTPGEAPIMQMAK